MTAADFIESEWVLPLTARPSALETARSYVRRDCALNGLDVRYASHVAGRLRKLYPLSVEQSIELAAAVISNSRWRPDLSRSPQVRALPRKPSSSLLPAEELPLSQIYQAYFEGQKGCPRCHPFQLADELPHWLPLVCVKHKIWLGTGTEPAHPASRETLSAHRKLNDLAKRGAANATSLIRAWDIVDRAAAQTYDSAVDHAESFVLAVRILALIEDPRWLIFDPALTFAVAYARLDAKLKSSPFYTPSLTDDVWRWARSDAARIRHDLLGLDPQRRPGSIMVRRGRPPIAATSSLEPFGNYLNCLQSAPNDPTVAFLETYYPQEGKFTAGSHAAFLCANGHNVSTAQPPTGWPDEPPYCRVCSGVERLAGFNRVRDLFPLVAERWDVTRNGFDLPDDASPYNNTDLFHWVCPQRHRYLATIRSQVERLLCPDCEPKSTSLSDLRNLAAVYPRALVLWCVDLYPSITPSRISPLSDAIYWWRCDVCKELYPRSPAELVSGKECGYCSGEETLPGVTDIVTLNRHYASNWDVDANRFPAYLVGPGFKGKAAWICAVGHPYKATLDQLESDNCCGTCAGRQLMQGFNDVATMLPEWRSRWDPTLNHGLQANQVLAVGDARRGWRCPKGHPYWKSVIEMRRNGECSVCLNKKVQSGVNDLALRYGAVVLDWDYEANLGRDPARVLPGNKARFWTCERGHTRYERPVNRMRTRGCPDCPMGARVGYEGPEQSA